MGKAWTPAEEDTLRAMFYEGATDAEVGDVLGRGFRSVCHRRHKLGLRHFKHYTPEEREAIRRGREAGMSAREIAAGFGRPVPGIRFATDRPGAMSNAHWLPEEDAYVVKAFADGLTDEEIAAKLKRSRTAVGYRRRALGVLRKPSAVQRRIRARLARAAK